MEFILANWTKVDLNDHFINGKMEGSGKYK